MNKIFTKVIAVLLVVLTVFQFSVFALPTENDIPLEGEAITGIQITLNEDFQKVLENNDYELYFSKQTAEISVVCKENGYVWYPNVNIVTEMTDLIMAQRAFQFNSKAMQSTDEMWGMINNLRGR